MRQVEARPAPAGPACRRSDLTCTSRSEASFSPRSPARNPQSSAAVGSIARSPGKYAKQQPLDPGSPPHRGEDTPPSPARVRTALAEAPEVELDLQRLPPADRRIKPCAALMRARSASRPGRPSGARILGSEPPPLAPKKTGNARAAATSPRAIARRPVVPRAPRRYAPRGHEKSVPRLHRRDDPPASEAPWTSAPSSCSPPSRAWSWPPCSRSPPSASPSSSASCASSTSRTASSSCSAPSLAWFVAHAARPAPGPRLRRRPRRQPAGRRADRRRARPAGPEAASTTSPRRSSSPPSASSTCCSRARSALYGPDARAGRRPVRLAVQLPWFGYSGYKLAVIAAAALILAAVWLLLTRTRIGLVMRATQWDRETATAFGIDVDRVYALVFGLGAGARRARRRADRADPAGPLPDGRRPAAALLHRRHHRRPRQPARHRGRRPASSASPTASSRCSSPPPLPRSSRPCSSPWSWSSARRASSAGARRETRPRPRRPAPRRARSWRRICPSDLPTPEQLAADNQLFLTLARKALHWEEPAEPFRIIGPLYFVGTRGLGVFLFVTPEGHILMNTGMPSSGPMIEESIRQLGFDPADIRVMINGHAHIDHAGAFA